MIIFTVLTRRLPRGGWKSPPPRFFSNLEKTGENFVKIFFLPEPNSFPDILKKKSCKSVKRLGHSNYVLEVYGGGWFSTPHIFSTCSSTRGGWFWPPPCRFFVYRPILMKFWYYDVINVNSQNHPKNWPYDPYDVICDVICSKIAKIQKFTKITFMNRFT